MHYRFTRFSLTVVTALVLLLVIMVGLAACGSNDTATTTTASSPETTIPPDAGNTSTTEAALSLDGVELTISAASSLKSAFTDIGAAFDAANGSTTVFNFDASGTLQKQIEAGAPVDVFASASPKQVYALLEGKFLDADSIRDFAGNEIVILLPANSTLAISSFEDLTKDDVKKIAYGDPAAAPHGVAAEEILTTLDLMDQIKPKVIYAANASQTMEYITSAEVDVAIAFASEAINGGDKVKVVATSQADWHSAIVYPLGIISDSKEKSAAQAFVDFVLGPEGQSILEKYGFEPAP